MTNTTAPSNTSLNPSQNTEQKSVLVHPEVLEQDSFKGRDMLHYARELWARHEKGEISSEDVLDMFIGASVANGNIKEDGYDDVFTPGDIVTVTALSKGDIVNLPKAFPKESTLRTGAVWLARKSGMPELMGSLADRVYNVTDHATGDLEAHLASIAMIEGYVQTSLYNLKRGDVDDESKDLAGKLVEKLRSHLAVNKPIDVSPALARDLEEYFGVNPWLLRDSIDEILFIRQIGPKKLATTAFKQDDWYGKFSDTFSGSGAAHKPAWPETTGSTYPKSPSTPYHPIEDTFKYRKS